MTSDLSRSCQKKAKGEELFDQVMYHLDIVEKDYFGLRFMDSAQVPVSTDNQLQPTLVLTRNLEGVCFWLDLSTLNWNCSSLE